MILILDLPRYQDYILQFVPCFQAYVEEFYELLKWGLEMSRNMSKSDEQNKSNGHILVEKRVTTYIFYQYGDIWQKVMIWEEYGSILVMGPFMSQNMSRPCLYFGPLTFPFGTWTYLTTNVYTLFKIHIKHLQCGLASGGQFLSRIRVIKTSIF